MSSNNEIWWQSDIPKFKVKIKNARGEINSNEKAFFWRTDIFFSNKQSHIFVCRRMLYLENAAYQIILTKKEKIGYINDENPHRVYIWITENSKFRIGYQNIRKYSHAFHFRHAIYV